MAEQAVKRQASRHKTRVVGWHPPVEQVAWFDAEVKQRATARGLTKKNGDINDHGIKSAILTEAVNLLAYRQSIFSVIDDLALPDDLSVWLAGEAERRGGENARLNIVAEALRRHKTLTEAGATIGLPPSDAEAGT